MIESLKPWQIFVFGSNLAGDHAGGAAKQAVGQFGAEWSVGEGLAGQTYAFPTLNADLTRRGYAELAASRDKLYATCHALPQKEFLLTAVGTGIAGYPTKEMKILFSEAPSNLVLPEEFLR